MTGTESVTVTQVHGVVVVGAGLGGLRVCESLRRLNYLGPITLIGDEVHPPYDRPPLSKDALKGTRANPPVLREADALETLELTLILGVAVTGIDLAAKGVHLDDGRDVTYDILVLATGARARTWPHGVTPPNVWSLRTADDAKAIGAIVAAKLPLVVLGAGFIGCEVAASAHEMGCSVTLLELTETPLSRAVGVVAGAEVARRLTAVGIDLRCGVTIEEVLEDATGAVEALRLSDGTEVKTAGVVVGLGVLPNTDLAQTAGIPVDDGIVCDAFGKTSHAGVYALGDAARWVNSRTGHFRRVEHWTTTTQQAQIVAAQIVGSDDKSLDEVPYFWSDMLGIKLQALGELSATADMEVILAGPAGDRPLFVYSRDGHVEGVLGFGLPSVVMRLTSLITAKAPVDELVTTVRGFAAPKPAPAS